MRTASEADLEEVVDLAWAVAAEGRWIGAEVPFDRAARRSRMSDMLTRDSATVLVADAGADGGPAVAGEIAVDIAPYGVADIGMLLARDWRGHGLGGALLRAAIDWARDHGAHKMALEVWPHNTVAIHLYERHGFVEEGRKRRHYRRRNGELWDAVLMGRPLT